MAELRDELILEIDQALRAIDQIEQALNRSLGAVEIRVDATQAQRQLDQLAQDADRALSDVDVDIDSAGAARLNSELAGVEQNLAEADREAGQLGRSIREVDRAADRVGNTSKELSGTFGTLETRAKSISSAFAAIGGTVILAGALRGANAAVQQFAVLEDSVNAVNVIFGNAAESVLEFGETAAQSAGLSSSAFNQAVTPLGALLQNFGFDAREAADASVILVQRAADLASVLGGDVQTALAAVSSALRGQSEPLTAYGATISAARVEQFALASGLAATKAEITDAITLQARYGLILADTSAVAGDYAATNEDLANAQRTLGGLATDLAGEFGEALAPAFEAILAQGPELIALFASLTPALADAAGNAAAASSGFTVGVTNVVLGIGGASNAFSSFGNVIQAGAEGLKGLALSLNPFRELGGEFDDFNTQVDEFNNNLAQDFINNAGLQIPRAIQAGITPINAFGTAIASLAQKDDSLETIQKGFARLAIQSGLTDKDVSRVTRSLLTQADALGLNADEVAFLEDRLRVLDEALDDGGRANADYLASITGITEAIPDFTSALDGVVIMAGQVGLTMTDLVLGLDPVARALTDTLTPAEQTALALQAIQTESGAAAAILANNLRPAIVDVSGALEDLNNDGKVTKTEFIANLEAMTAAAIETGIGLASIATFSPETAAALAALPIEQAIDLVKQFRGDEEGIRAAAEAITGTPEQLGAAILEVYGEALTVLQSGDRKAIDTFLALLANDIEKDIPGVTAAFTALFQPALFASFADLAPPPLTPVFTSSVEGMDTNQIAASLDTVLFASFADVTPPDLTEQMRESIEGWSAATLADAVENALFANVDVDLTEAGIQSRATFFDGLSTPQSGEVAQLASSITQTLDSAIQRDSPPKLFLDAGKDSGKAFWSGFETDLVLRKPELGVTGSATSTAAAATGNGINVNLTTVNPIQQDEVSDVARMGQIASSIASTYRSVV